MFPFFFAKAVFTFGDPIYVPEDSTEEQVEGYRLELENRIHTMEAEAEGMLGYKYTRPAVPALTESAGDS